MLDIYLNILISVKVILCISCILAGQYFASKGIHKWANRRPIIFFFFNLILLVRADDKALQRQVSTQTILLESYVHHLYQSLHPFIFIKLHFNLVLHLHPKQELLAIIDTEIIFDKENR